MSTPGTLRLRVAHTGTAWKVAIFHTITGIEAEIAYFDTYAAAAAKSRALLDGLEQNRIRFTHRMERCATAPAVRPFSPELLNASRNLNRALGQGLTRFAEAVRATHWAAPNLTWDERLRRLDAAASRQAREEVPEC